MIIILAALAWWLVKGDIPKFCDRAARVAGMAYALGVVCGQYVHLANDWLADRVTGGKASPMSAEALLGAENFILLSEEALEVECLFFPEPAPAPKRRRTRAVKVATGG